MARPLNAGDDTGEFMPPKPLQELLRFMSFLEHGSVRAELWGGKVEVALRVGPEHERSHSADVPRRGNGEDALVFDV